MAAADTYDVYALTGDGSAASPFMAPASQSAVQNSISISDTDSFSTDKNVLGTVPGDTFTSSENGIGALTYVGYVHYNPPGASPAIFAAVGETTSGQYYMFVAAGTPITSIEGSTFKFTKVHPATGKGEWNINTEEPNCFLSGTMLETTVGPRAVETLRAGDMVVTADGQERAIRWIGTTVLASRFADPIRTWPIRIKAGAIAENVPLRDLLLSPGHAVLVGDVLAHASALVNGTSIVRETEMPRVFAYYHVEVEEHALLMAENLPCESFLEAVSDIRLDNFPERAALTGNAPQTEMSLPRVKAFRQLPMGVRTAIQARVKQPLLASENFQAA